MIEEIVRNRYDNYSLHNWKSIPTVEELVLYFSDSTHQSELSSLDNAVELEQWRKALIIEIDQKLGLDGAVKLKENDDALKNTLFLVASRCAERLREAKPTPQLDKELQTYGESFGYRVSRRMVDEDYRRLRKKLLTVDSPADIEQIAESYCEQRLPNNFETLLSELKKGDINCWDEMFCYIKRLSLITLRWAEGRGNANYLDCAQRYIEADVISDTSYFIYKEVTENRLKKGIDSAEYFRNHILAVCRNILLNAERRYNKRRFARLEPHQEEVAVEKEESQDYSELIYDVDIDDERSVRLLLVHILLRKEHPWYRELTQGEVNMNVFEAVYIQKRSYREVAQEIFGEELTNIEERLCSRLRKGQERTKDRLMRRMYRMLESFRQNGYYEPTAM